MTLKPKKPSNISLKRISIGFVILFPCTIMIIVIGMYYYNLIDSSLRQHYIGKQTNEVLGITLEEKYPSDLERITETYKVDEYVKHWEFDEEGYYYTSKYLELPKTSLYGPNAKWEQEWKLKDNINLKLSCPPIEFKDAFPGRYFSCSLSYNEKLIDKGVRYHIDCPDDGKTCSGEVSMVVFSPTYPLSAEFEYIVVGSYQGGSYDTISVFRLENGEATLIPFNDGSEDKDEWWVSDPLSVDLYSNENNGVKFVTRFHNPATGPVNICRIWDIGDKSLVLDKTVGDIFLEI